MRNHSKKCKKTWVEIELYTQVEMLHWHSHSYELGGLSTGQKTLV
jgi:hypothetical protein